MARDPRSMDDDARRTSREVRDIDDDTRRTGREVRADAEQTVELREEELRASKERAQVGEVEIGKRVVEEEKTVDVPVTREEVVVERHDVDRRPVSGTIGDSETIEVPVYEESVDVEKQAVVYEELSVGKQPVQDTEKVTETVRREVADLGTSGDLDVDGRDDARRRR